jgi:hypothetical protein
MKNLIFIYIILLRCYGCETNFTYNLAKQINEKERLEKLAFFSQDSINFLNSICESAKIQALTEEKVKRLTFPILASDLIMKFGVPQSAILVQNQMLIEKKPIVIWKYGDLEAHIQFNEQFVLTCERITKFDKVKGVSVEIKK